MLPKNRRIPRRSFQQILSNNKRFNSHGLVLFISPIDPTNQKNSRFSFSVSKKVKTRAVDRNKLRRRGYSVISKHLKNIKPGYYLFFSFKKTTKADKFSVLEEEIKQLLSDSGMIS